jgi:excinuclease ABC subunit A
MNVGLNYLALPKITLAVKHNAYRLATQIGSQLVECFYILDEPSIGLHQEIMKTNSFFRATP